MMFDCLLVWVDYCLMFWLFVVLGMFADCFMYIGFDGLFLTCWWLMVGCFVVFVVGYCLWVDLCC